MVDFPEAEGQQVENDALATACWLNSYQVVTVEKTIDGEDLGVKFQLITID